jgi:FAD/FMN-containing dehydrogenase
MEQDIGPLYIEVMDNIKRALDPKNILNPGKVVPTPGGRTILA